jgi:hypothetical protein|tara:strand:+ start:105 stop:371 length:267 start_codon:yes stop_codon:yes gene_type:complete
MVINTATDDDWEPRESDIAWSSNLIRIMKQGGMWALKDWPSVYKFDHANQRLITIKNGDADMHAKIVKVFGKVGWTVVEPGGLNPERN